MTIYLIRHGETEFNAARVLQPPETPLGERGREQARRLANHLAGAGIVHILSSDLLRAEQTARALEATTRASLEFEPLLQERNFGDLRGTAYSDLDEDPFQPGYAPPGGETEPDFRDRVARAWERIVLASEGLGGGLAVVSHGLVLQAVALHHVDSGGLAAPDSPLRFRNTSYSVIEGAAPWRLVALGRDDHLEGMDDRDTGEA